MLKVKQTKEDLLFEGGFTFPTANNMRDDLSNEQWGGQRLASSTEPELQGKKRLLLFMALLYWQ